PRRPRPPHPTLSTYTTLFRSRYARELTHHRFNAGGGLPAGASEGRDALVGRAPAQLLLDAQHLVVLGHAVRAGQRAGLDLADARDRKSTRLNSSHVKISYAVF